MIEQVLMHMPQPITLTEREQCVLRVMERVGRRGQRRRQRRFVWCCAARGPLGTRAGVLAAAAFGQRACSC